VKYPALSQFILGDPGEDPPVARFLRRDEGGRGR
jgi:hypothetical protein